MTTIKPPPCTDIVKEHIEKDQSTGQYYLIPASLDLNGLPQKVINSFLDWLNKFPEGNQQVLLRCIKDGLLELQCD
jgi:hypothetical protein